MRTTPPDCVNMAISASPNAMNFAENQQPGMILEKLWGQRESGRFCDVILYVQGQKFRAHRSVLAAGSPYFDSVLKTHKIVKEQLTITCQNLESFQMFLNFLYTGAVSINKGNASELLRLANHFLVSKLKNYCAEYLDRHLDPSNCLAAKEQAESYSLQPLLKNTVAFIHNNIVEIFDQSELLDFTCEKLEKFLHENQSLVPQHFLVTFISKWINHNALDRAKHLKTLLKVPKLESVDLQYFEDHLNSLPLYRKHPKCMYLMLSFLEDNKIKIPSLENTYLSLKTQYKGNQNSPEIPAPVFFDPNWDDNAPITVLPLEMDDLEEDGGFFGGKWWTQMSETDEESSNSSFENIPPENGEESVFNFEESEKSGPLLPANSNSRKNLHSKSKSSHFRRSKKRRRSRFHKKSEKGSLAENPVAAGTSKKHGSDTDIDSDGENIDNDAMEEDSSSATEVSLEESISDQENASKWRDGVKCPNCSFVAHSSIRLEQHVSRIHAKEAIYKCKICDFTCKWNREYYGHMKTHFEGPPFKCDSCAFKSDAIQGLMSHRMSHSDERPFKCEECDFRCRTKAGLETHAKSHACEERPFACEQCELRFATKPALDQHAETHLSEERPYLCDSCGFSTKHQSHLVAHKKMHVASGEVFHCQFPNCSYSTPKKSQLGSHQRTHTAVRSHVCATCGRAFIEKSHLVRHERIHLNDKPFKCEHCDYSSSRRDKLKEHFRKHHGENATAKGPYRPRKQRRQQGYEVGGYSTAKRVATEPAESGHQSRHPKDVPKSGGLPAGFPRPFYEPPHRDMLQNHAAMALQQLGVAAHGYHQAAFLDPHQAVMEQQSRISMLAAATNAVGQPPEYSPFMPFL